MLSPLPPRRAARAAHALLFAFAATACARRPTQTPPDWRDQLLGSARAAQFESERPPVVEGNVSPAELAELPQMTFARVRNPRGDTRVVGRITSKGVYPRLGIAEGENYVWLVAGKRPRIAVLPADASRLAYWLAGGPHLGAGGDVCQTDPNFFRLSIEPTGAAPRDDAAGPSGTASPAAFVAIYATCVCVNGAWVHVGGTDEAVSARSAGAFFSKR